MNRKRTLSILTALSLMSIGIVQPIEAHASVLLSQDTQKPNAPTINSNSNWSNQNQVVTMKDNGDNGIAGVDRVEYSLSGATAQGWTTYTSPLTISAEGITTINSRVIDKAGNISDVTTATVKIDKTNPVLTVTPDITGLTNTDVTLTAIGTDALSGVKRIKLPNGNYINASQTTFQVGNNGTYSFEVDDNSGNITPLNVVINNIKKNVLITNNPDVNLELHADDLYSGVANMRFRNENNAWSSWENYATSKDWMLSSVDGLKHVWVQYMDKVGNISQEIEDIIILDTTKPVVQSFQINKGNNYTQSTNVKLTINANDSGTGMKDMYISNDNQTWTKMPYTNSDIDWTLPNGDGLKTVYVKVSDTAGNISDVMTDTIFHDTTKPIANISINNGDKYTPTRDVKLTLTYSDIGGSGIDTVKVIEGDKEYTLPAPTPNSPVTIPWTLDFGTVKTVSVVAIDKAGNASDMASDSIIVDKLTINQFTLDNVVNPSVFNNQTPFNPLVWAFAPQPMVAGGNISFSIDVKQATDTTVVDDKVDYKVDVIGDNGYHKAFIGTMTKAGDHYSQTIMIPKDTPSGAKVYVSATAQRTLLVSPYDVQTIYFPGGDDPSQQAQIGTVGGNIFGDILFNETQ